jgi:uncharacterized protein with HEPN domain
LEVVGEAAARVTAPTRSRLSAVPWQSIVGMRNRLIHGYDEVDLDVVWEVVEKDLPPLIEALDKELSSPSES